jgi:hypothetical protein
MEIFRFETHYRPPAVPSVVGFRTRPSSGPASDNLTRLRQPGSLLRSCRVQKFLRNLDAPAMRSWPGAVRSGHGAPSMEVALHAAGDGPVAHRNKHTTCCKVCKVASRKKVRSEESICCGSHSRSTLRPLTEPQQKSHYHPSADGSCVVLWYHLAQRGSHQLHRYQLNTKIHSTFTIEVHALALFGLSVLGMYGSSSRSSPCFICVASVYIQFIVRRPIHSHAKDAGPRRFQSTRSRDDLPRTSSCACSWNFLSPPMPQTVNMVFEKKKRYTRIEIIT